MEKRKVVTIKPDELTNDLKFVGRGYFARKTGDAIEIYKRYWSINPKRTLVGIMGFSVLLGVFIGALVW